MARGPVRGGVGVGVGTFVRGPCLCLRSAEGCRWCRYRNDSHGRGLALLTLLRETGRVGVPERFAPSVCVGRAGTGMFTVRAATHQKAVHRIRLGPVPPHCLVRAPGPDRRLLPLRRHSLPHGHSAQLLGQRTSLPKNHGPILVAHRPKVFHLFAQSGPRWFRLWDFRFRWARDIIISSAIKGRWCRSVWGGEGWVGIQYRAQPKRACNYTYRRRRRR